MYPVHNRRYEPVEYNRPQPAGPVAGRPRPRPRTTGVIAFLLFLSFLVAAAYTAFQYWPAAPEQRSAAKAAPTAEIPASEAEDYTRHLETAEGASLRAAEEIKRAQAWMKRTIPALEQNYLAADNRRLDAAMAASEAARRYVQQARDEMEITKDLLIERSKPEP
jgi:hypothetical protein